MKLECEATFKSLGQPLQIRLLQKYPDQARCLFENPTVKIVVEVDPIVRDID